MSCEKVACFQVLLVLTDFYYNKITKQEAREMLSNLLPEVPPPYVQEAQVILDKILEEDVVVDVVQKVEEEADIAPQPQDEIPVVVEPYVQPDVEPEQMGEPDTQVLEDVAPAEEPVETAIENQYEETPILEEV